MAASVVTLVVVADATWGTTLLAVMITAPGIAADDDAVAILVARIAVSFVADCKVFTEAADA